MFPNCVCNRPSHQEQRLANIAQSHYLNIPAVVLESDGSKQDTLMCAYTLSHDNNWVIVAITDASGHITDTAIYAVEGPTRYVTPSLK